MAEGDIHDAQGQLAHRHIADENARQRSFADGLGIRLADMVGMAYDSPFRRLRAAEMLLTPEGRQVLAPFAFVSALAGVLLVNELLRANADEAITNYWKASPWRAPMARLRDSRPRHPHCEFCSRPESLEVARLLWQRSG